MDLKGKIYDLGLIAQRWTKFDVFCLCFVGGGVTYFLVQIARVVCG